MRNLMNGGTGSRRLGGLMLEVISHVAVND